MADGDRRPKRYTAEQALRLLQGIDYDDSGDEDSVLTDDLDVVRESEAEEDEDDMPAAVGSEERNESGIHTSRAGIGWKNITSFRESGRAPIRLSLIHI